MNEYTEFDTAAEMQKALDRKKAAYGDLNTSLVEFTDGTTAPVVDGLIGLTEDEEEAMAVNSLIAKDERPSFQPSTAELAMFLIFFFLCLGLSLHTVMRGDKAAMNGMALPRVESGVGSGR